MEISRKLIEELQNRLKVGNRRGVHLNCIPGRSRYKFDLTRLKHIDENLPNSFIEALLSQISMKFKVSWKDNVPDLNTLFEDDQTQLVKITKSFENLINQTNAIESEKGINTFGFGFPVLVRRDQQDNKLTVAPILIWSLRIKQTKEFNTWYIHRNEEDPIYINEVLINHLISDSQIEIDKISSEYLEDGLIDENELVDICISIIKAINTSVDENMKDVFQQKLVNIQPIKDKKFYEDLPLTSNNSFVEFGGLFSIFEVQKQNIINDYSELLELEELTIDQHELKDNFFQPISSVLTDPSQQGILNSLSSTRNLLIQGPPGTGKSQSLTAILINALENQIKTIVVCEKQTALDVLHKALIEKGLHYHCILIKDIVRDRRKVVDSVRERVDSSSYRKYRYLHSKETLESITTRAQKLIDSINKKHHKLSEKLIGTQNWTDIVGKLISEIKKSDKKEIELDGIDFEYNLKEMNSFLELINNGEKHYLKFKPFKNNSFLNSNKLNGDNPYLIENEIKADFKYYKDEVDKISKKINNLKKQYYDSRVNQLTVQESKLSELLATFITLENKYENNSDFYLDSKTNGTFYKFASLFNKNKKSIISDQTKLKNIYIQILKSIQSSSDLPGLEKMTLIKDIVKSIKEYNKSLSTNRVKFSAKISQEFIDLDLTKEIPQKSLRSDLSNEIKLLLTKIINKVNSDNWTDLVLQTNNHNKVLSDIEKIIKKQQEYLSNEDDLYSIEFSWFNFFNNLDLSEQLILNRLFDSNNWKSTFLKSYLNSLLANFADSNLPTNNLEHEEFDSTVANLDKEQIKFIKEYWYSKQIDSTRYFDANNPNIAVENLYNKRSSKRHKRLSLREIVKLDIDLFTTFFPIVLTTPDVASNLFKNKNKYFDIVMFDEASQLKLEDNLPALLKGKQIIIAGDEHQMPPSNYFSKIFEGNIDESDDDFEDEQEQIRQNLNNSIMDCESLLEFASQLGFEKLHLDFHYRSRHPYLIDFSNFAFYNQRLKPLPNTFDYVPIKYINVNGTYSETSNDLEAESIISIIENNITRLPNGDYPSVGIATFNINQRNLILSKINSRRKFSKFTDFNEKIVELEENGFFVKNLENIQGDERDVIILSTTYGINKEGKFQHRFGSINSHQKGYKLLNVIITRAKYKIYVVTSIPEDVILNYREYLITEGSNNRRAVLFAYLAYSKAVSESDDELRLTVLNTLKENSTKNTKIDILNSDLESPFEEEVFSYLLDYFPENQLIPQLKYAGFRIDIVYNPINSNAPKVAIECDGATYHSSNEAYLHDKHRQKILESNGFVFHRIWSTNWWRNPKKEIKKLVDFINSVETDEKLIKIQDITPAIAFSDNIESLSKLIASKNNNDTLKEQMYINAIAKTKSTKSKLINNKIGLNSIVTVKYNKLNKELKVQLVDKAKINKTIKDGVQEIKISSPLGLALKGKTLGDTTKVGDLDKYVDIIDVDNKAKQL